MNTTDTTTARREVTPGMAHILEAIIRRRLLGNSLVDEIDGYLKCFGMRAEDIADLIEVKVTKPDAVRPVTDWDQGAAEREVNACIESGWYRLTPWERGFITSMKALIKNGCSLTKAQIAKVDAIHRRRVYRYEHMAG